MSNFKFSGLASGLAALLLAATVGSAPAFQAEVISKVKIRSGPGNDYTPHGELHRGDTAEIRECDDYWCQLDGGGYVRRNSLNAPELGANSFDPAFDPNSGNSDQAIDPGPGDPGEDSPGFQTPSGNIFCQLFDNMDPELIRCDIQAIDTQPEWPADCDSGYGHSFAVYARGRAKSLCVGNSVVDITQDVLQYGQTWRGAGMTCVSKKTGLTCTNEQGYGFSLSRASQVLF
jgi:hypothetical protein